MQAALKIPIQSIFGRLCFGDDSRSAIVRVGYRPLFECYHVGELMFERSPFQYLAEQVNLGNRLPQYGGLSRRPHQGQFVGESLTLTHNDSSIFLCFLRMIDDLDRLPGGDMQVLAGAEDAV